MQMGRRARRGFDSSVGAFVAGTSLGGGVGGRVASSSIGGSGACAGGGGSAAAVDTACASAGSTASPMGMTAGGAWFCLFQSMLIHSMAAHMRVITSTQHVPTAVNH